MKFNFAFDLDGTITKKEILPIIAKEIGISQKMSVLTRKTMDGDISFDLSFTERVNMLKTIPISRVKKIVEQVPISKHILNFLQENHDRCYIVTCNLDVWVELLVKKIGVTCLCSQAEYKGDKLLGIKTIQRKNDVHSLSKNPVVAIGDGNNDLEMLMEAPISIAYGGVHSPAASLLQICQYAIYKDKELCRFLRQLL